MTASIIKVCDKRPFKRALAGRASYICGSGLIGRQEHAHLWSLDWGKAERGRAAQERLMYALHRVFERSMWLLWIAF